MGNFILTNCINKFEKGISDLSNRGLKESSRIKFNNTYFASFHKRGYVNENFVPIDDNSFICCVGTLIFDGFTGQKALKKLFDKFDGNPEDIQYNSTFQGTLIIRKNGETVVFCDKYNVYWTYYTVLGDSFFVSSSLSVTIKSLDKKVLNLDRLLEAIMQRGTIGHKMFYDGVKRLFGNETIIIKSEGLKINRFSYDNNQYDFEKATENEIMNVFSETFLKVIEGLYGAFGNKIGIHQTGGLDSRLILAAFVKLGYKPTLLYGLGNTPLTSQFDDDRKVVEKLSKKFGLKTYFMNWKINGLISVDETIQGFKNFGFNCNENYCNKSWYNEYEQNVVDFANLLLDGHMGETLNIEGEDVIFNGKYPEKFNMDYIFNEYQKVFFNNFSWKSKDKMNAHLYYLQNELKDIVENTFHLPSKDGLMDIKNYQKYWHIRYRPADAHPTNLFNEFFSSLSPLGIPDLHDLVLNIPFHLIKDRGFSIKTIDRWVPEMNSVGVFSRARLAKIENGKIIRAGGKKEELIKSIYNITPNPIRNIYRGVKKTVKPPPSNLKSPMWSFYADNLKNCEVLSEVFDFDKQIGDVRVLATAFIYSKGIETLGYDVLK